MIDAIEELRVIYKQSRRSMQQVVNDTGLSKSTVYSVLSDNAAVVKDNQNFYTILTIAEALGAEIHISTPESRAAIDQSDVSYYREMLGKLYAQIEAQNATIASQQHTIEAQRGTIEQVTTVMYKIMTAEK